MNATMDGQKATKPSLGPWTWLGTLHRDERGVESALEYMFIWGFGVVVIFPCLRIAASMAVEIYTELAFWVSLPFP